jgi:hypothetical protein
MPYLAAELLENRGAQSRDIIEASLRGVRKGHIYLGVFGQEYSKLTIDEYREAVKQRKPCLTYVKDIRGRSPELARFINDELRYRFKYHKFRSNKGLLYQVKRDLESLLYEFMEAGLEEVQKRKTEAKAVEKDVTESAEAAGTEKSELQKIFDEAYSAFENRMYMAAITTTATAIEVAIRGKLQEISLVTPEQSRKMPLGMLVDKLQRNELITSDDAGALREVQFMRNKAVHEGQVPSRESVEHALKWASSFLNKLYAQTP